MPRAPQTKCRGALWVFSTVEARRLAVKELGPRVGLKRVLVAKSAKSQAPTILDDVFEVAAVRPEVLWPICGQVGVLGTGRSAHRGSERATNSAKLPKISSRRSEARHLPEGSIDLGACKHVNSATSCVGGVADHRRPRAGSNLPALAARFICNDRVGTGVRGAGLDPHSPTGQVDCLEEVTRDEAEHLVGAGPLSQCESAPW